MKKIESLRDGFTMYKEKGQFSGANLFALVSSPHGKLRTDWFPTQKDAHSYINGGPAYCNGSLTHKEVKEEAEKDETEYQN